MNQIDNFQKCNITHVLSVIKHQLEPGRDAFRDTKHLSVDVNDMDDDDIVVHFPRMVRFIDGALANPTSGAVLVHCAVGKSRSATAVAAYLLWKYPAYFKRHDPTVLAKDAVQTALALIREGRPMAQPNDGFLQQLEMWWDMGCPADNDDTVEKEPVYQRWLYKREVEDAARIGCAPDQIRFEDLEAEKENKKAESGGVSIRCKRCRRTLATQPFIIKHQGNFIPPDCPHVFVEALSWMRSTLEGGALEGRLCCPNQNCGLNVGRYAWQGFKCSCGDWVAPAISLQKKHIDEITTRPTADGTDNQRGNTLAGRLAGLNIRLPPGSSSPADAGIGGRQEKGNL